MNDLALHDDSAAGARPILLSAEGLVLRDLAGAILFDRLSLDIGPGLTFVRGGEQRGKSVLLRLLAGKLQTEAGKLSWPAAQAGQASVFLFDGDDIEPDSTVVGAWLQQQSHRHPGWNPALLDELVQDFGLGGHLGKTLHMLSTGSRRKVMLAAAFASGASLTLLEKPFAALDASSRALLAELLQEAAAHPKRAWVLADYDLPAALARVGLAATVDLGD
jgi:ABC-type transport system involved in cytochrome c biogenesis ATPase subunit